MNKLVKQWVETDDPSSLPVDWHRRIVGGNWDRVGAAQLAFMVRNGMDPHHTLLDVGCGSLRAGVRFIGYLDEGNYYGLEEVIALLQQGIDVEIPRYNLAPKRPTFITNGAFDLTSVPAGLRFDFAVAQGVFTHLVPEQIETCVGSVLSRLAEGGKFFATFHVGARTDLGQRVEWGWQQKKQVARTKAVYTRDDLERMAANAGASLLYMGDWEHPRKAQRMFQLAPC